MKVKKGRNEEKRRVEVGGRLACETPTNPGKFSRGTPPWRVTSPFTMDSIYDLRFILKAD